jgi:hypothetical protein
VTVPDALLVLIRAAVPSVVVYDAGVPSEPPERYAVFWPNDGDRNMGTENSRVGVLSTGENYRFQVSSVAPDRQMAAWIARRIRDAITDHTPTAEGYSCGAIQHLLSASPDPEEQVLARRRVLMADTYQLLTDRIEVGS